MRLRQVPHLPELAETLWEQGPLEVLRVLGTMPHELREALGPAGEFAARQLLAEQAPAEALDGIPFYSLCRGFFLPMLSLPPEATRRLFGVSSPPETRLDLLQQLLDRPIGLSLEEKVVMASGDLYAGKPPAVGEETLLQLLAEETLRPLSELRRELVKAGGLPALYASSKTQEKADPPLSARVVAVSLTRLKEIRGRGRREVVKDLLGRAGRLEAYVLVGLLLDKLHMGYASRPEQLLGLLAARWDVPVETLQVATGLRDLGEVCRLVERGGVAALQKIVLQPLTAFRPALASGSVDKLVYPVWAECKYDGIRLLLHKQTDRSNSVQVAAYTRRRHDWSELLTGLRPLMQALPCRDAILDGELHGQVLSPLGAPRPATVYEVHQRIRGEGVVQLRYVAFDLLYLDGQDWTKLPFGQRRARLEQLVQGAAGLPVLPIQISQGARAETNEQLLRYYEQYRRQGHEGLMVKGLDSPYPIAQRSPHWRKKKPEETLDLVLTAAYWGESSSPGQRVFDSYAISCRTPNGLQEVGTVAGVDVQTTGQIAGEILRYNLLTGQPAEHRGHNRVASGVRLAAHLVASVRFEGVLRDAETGAISLRGPRIVALRSGEMPVQETSALRDLETLALKHHLQ